MADTTNTMVALLQMVGNTTASYQTKESKRQHAGLDYSKGVECHAYNLGVTVATDASRPTQLLTRPNATPVSFWCVVGSASPLIFQSAFNGEVLKTVTLTVPSIAATGKEQQLLKYEWTNAVIVNLVHNAGLNTSTTGSGGITVVPGTSTANLEMISITFEGFTMTHLVGNTVGAAQVVTRT